MLHQIFQVFYRDMKRQFALDDDARSRALYRSSLLRNSGTMAPISHCSADRITLRIPVIMMVLAATAIPVELRPLTMQH